MQSTNPPDLLRIRDCLARKESVRVGSIALHLLAGIPMLFLGPLILGTIFWFVTWSLLGHSLSWSTFFLLGLFIFVPLLFWTEVSTHGNYFADAVVSSGGASPIPYAFGTELGMLISFVANPRTSASGFVELFLTGPRFVLHAWRDLKSIKLLRTVDRDQVALLVGKLEHSQSGILTVSLPGVGQTLQSLAPMLSYLLFYDLIGISKTGDRVWLESQARSELRK